jgi:hypothetical protein
MHGQLSAQQEQLGECKGLSVRGEFRMNAPRHFELGVRRRSWNGCRAMAAARKPEHREIVSIFNQPIRHNGVTGMNIENWKQTDKSTHESQTKRDVAPGTADRHGGLETGKHEKARGVKQGSDQKAAIKDAPHSSVR